MRTWVRWTRLGVTFGESDASRTLAGFDRLSEARPRLDVSHHKQKTKQ
jgi:hypothetical protein